MIPRMIRAFLLLSLLALTIACAGEGCPAHVVVLA